MNEETKFQPDIRTIHDIPPTPNKNKENRTPSPAYIGATWTVFLVGVICYLVGLYNAEMQLNEKGYYFTILLFGLFSVVALQKSVRDKLDGIPVTSIFFGISWFGTIVSILLLIIGLWNAELLLSEKGFYGIAFTMSMYAAISVQKNIRDAEK